MADAIKLSCRNSQTISPFIPVSPSTSCQRAQVGPRRSVVSLSGVSSAACAFLCPTASTTPKKLGFFKIYATVTETEQPKWWERNAGPNMIDIHSTQEFLNALSEAGDRLVIVEFYGTWCASCRAIFPKICRTAVEHHDILFLKINFDENKPMCKKLNVRVLPYFQFYRGADGLLEAFSCSLSKFQRIKDAIELHSSARCSLGPPKGIPDLNLEIPQYPKENLEESSGT